MERAKSFVIKKTSSSSNTSDSNGEGGGSERQKSVLPKSMLTLGKSSSFVVRGSTDHKKAKESEVKVTEVEAIIKEFQRVRNKPKIKFKEETKLFLKLHIIHQKAIELEAMLKDLQALTESFQEETEALKNERRLSSAQNGHVALRSRGESFDQLEPLAIKTEEASVDSVLQIQAELRLLKRLVLFLCRHRSLEKHLG